MELIKKINWDEYLFRCSQLSKINTGVIGFPESKEKRIIELVNERDTGINKNGNKIKFTEKKQKEYEKLVIEKLNPSLPKTLTSEIKKIWRAERHNRNFTFTNKYVQKGIKQEEEGITVYQEYRKKVLGLNSYFTKNTERLYSKYFSGEPDLSLGNDVKNCKQGFDIKCSWSLESFPFFDDKLEGSYESQNDGYMELTGAESWITAHILVNATETLLNNEKNKYFYAMGSPNDESEEFQAYLIKAKEVERMLIFDYDRFIERNPGHLLEYTRDEWMNTINPVTGVKGLDIPLEFRVVERLVERNESRIDKLKDRVIVGRKELKRIDTEMNAHFESLKNRLITQTV